MFDVDVDLLVVLIGWVWGIYERGEVMGWVIWVDGGEKFLNFSKSVWIVEFVVGLEEFVVGGCDVCVGEFWDGIWKCVVVCGFGWCLVLRVFGVWCGCYLKFLVGGIYDVFVVVYGIWLGVVYGEFVRIWLWFGILSFYFF